MIVRHNAKKNKDQFPVEIILNAGAFYFTIRAAKELRDRLTAVIKALETSTEAQPRRP